MKSSLDILLNLKGFTEVTISVLKQLIWAANHHGHNQFYQYTSNFTERCEIGTSTLRKHLSLLEKEGLIERLGRTGRDGRRLLFSYDSESLLKVTDKLYRAQVHRNPLEELIQAIKRIDSDFSVEWLTSPVSTAEMLSKILTMHFSEIQKAMKRSDLLAALSALALHADISHIIRKVLT